MQRIKKKIKYFLVFLALSLQIGFFINRYLTARQFSTLRFFWIFLFIFLAFYIFGFLYSFFVYIFFKKKNFFAVKLIFWGVSSVILFGLFIDVMQIYFLKFNKEVKLLNAELEIGNLLKDKRLEKVNNCSPGLCYKFGTGNDLKIYVLDDSGVLYSLFVYPEDFWGYLYTKQRNFLVREFFLPEGVCKLKKKISPYKYWYKLDCKFDF